MKHFDALAALLRSRSAKAGVIGLGYVGLPLAEAIARAGFSVTGFDINPELVTAIEGGVMPFPTRAAEGIAQARAAGRFSATTDFARLKAMDIVLICVPTPLSRQREPDLSFVTATAQTLASQLRAGQLIVLESTSFPGTTAEVVRPILEARGSIAGRDFFLGFSPEREDPGNPDFHTANTPRVTGADDPRSLALMRLFYGAFVPETHAVSSTRAAEAVKLTENIFRSVNIALVNELKLIYARMGIDIWEVIEAAKTKPFGFMPFYPGPGIGGHCIPVDPFYLTWKAREFGFATRFVELSGEINAHAPMAVIETLTQALGARLGKPLFGSKILILGIAYKRDVGDVRESPALRIIDLIEEQGGHALYHDPHVPSIPATRQHPHLSGRRSVSLTDPEALGADAALIVADHSDVDYESIVGQYPLTVDTRNATRSVVQNRTRIVRA